MINWQLYADAGLTPLPIDPESRVPLVKYKRYQEVFDISWLRDDWALHPNADMAIMCRREVCIDVDRKAFPPETGDEIVAEILDFFMNDPEFGHLVNIEITKTDGIHVWFRTNVLRQSCNFAEVLTNELDSRGNQKVKPLIELKAFGMTCRCAPSGGIQVLSGDILNLPILTYEQFERIEARMRQYNQFQRPPKAILPPPVRVEGLTRAGDDYSSNCDINNFMAMLETHGYTKVRHLGQRIYLRRPGAKTKGIDSNFHVGLRTFVNHSGGDGDFEPRKGYSMFGVYAILEHGGDFKAATRAVVAMGFGEQREPHDIDYTLPPRPIVETTGDLDYGDPGVDLDYGEPQAVVLSEEDRLFFDMVRKSEIDLSNPPKLISRLSFWELSGAAVPGGTGLRELKLYGNLLVIKGKFKSRKTALASAIVASAMQAMPICGFAANRDQRPIIWIDTEQGQGEYWKVQRRIAVMAGMKTLPDYYHPLWMRAMSTKERVSMLKRAIKQWPDAGIIVMDGIRDFLFSINKEEEVKPLVDMVMQLADENNAMFIPLIHMNKKDQDARGVLGTELANKCDVMLACNYMREERATEVIFEAVRGAETPDPFKFVTRGPNIPYIEGWPEPEYDYSIGYHD